jgi:hypothetical protein
MLNWIEIQNMFDGILIFQAFNKLSNTQTIPTPKRFSSSNSTINKKMYNPSGVDSICAIQ